MISISPPQISSRQEIHCLIVGIWVFLVVFQSFDTGLQRVLNELQRLQVRLTRNELSDIRPGQSRLFFGSCHKLPPIGLDDTAILLTPTSKIDFITALKSIN